MRLGEFGASPMNSPYNFGALRMNSGPVPEFQGDTFLQRL